MKRRWLLISVLILVAVGIFYWHHEVRGPLYLFRTSDGRFIYVSVDKAATTDYYERFKVYIGPRDKLQALTVNQAAVFRDGGTMHVQTDQGWLRRPIQGVPTWQERPIDLLDYKNFVITEASKTASVIPK